MLNCLEALEESGGVDLVVCNMFMSMTTAASLSTIRYKTYFLKNKDRLGGNRKNPPPPVSHSALIYCTEVIRQSGIVLLKTHFL